MLVAASVWGSAASAADLSKIERTIHKEPTYESKPKYCLLVFGPEAKTRVWLVQDGLALFVDRNANGDLTEPGEKVEKDKVANVDDIRSFDAGEIKDGSLTHSGLSVTQFKMTPDSVGNAKEFQRIAGSGSEAWTWWIRINAERPPDANSNLPKRVKYVANGDGLGYLLFGDQPQTAPVIHFNGPWTLGLQDIKQRLEIGKSTMLQIGVGTPGIGAGSFAFVLYPGLIPADAYPEAEIAYPLSATSNDTSPTRVTLKKRC